MIEYYERAKEVLFSPNTFFSKLKKEDGLGVSMKYLVVMLVVNALLLVLMGIVIGTNSTLSQYNSLAVLSDLFAINSTYLYLGFFISTIVLGFVISFVYACFIFLWLMIFNGKEGYEKAYQLFVYANTPSYVFGWIPFIGGFAGVYYLVLMILGTEQVYGFSRKKAVLIYLVPLLIIGVLMGIMLAIGVTLFNTGL